MRLRIVRPLPKELEGIPLDNLAFQGSYDLPAPLSELLVASGYAIPEDHARNSPTDGPVSRGKRPKRARAKRTRTVGTKGR